MQKHFTFSLGKQKQICLRNLRVFSKRGSDAVANMKWKAPRWIDNLWDTLNLISYIYAFFEEEIKSNLA